MNSKSKKNIIIILILVAAIISFYGIQVLTAKDNIEKYIVAQNISEDSFTKEAPVLYNWKTHSMDKFVDFKNSDYSASYVVALIDLWDINDYGKLFAPFYEKVEFNLYGSINSDIDPQMGELDNNGKLIKELDVIKK